MKKLCSTSVMIVLGCVLASCAVGDVLPNASANLSLAATASSYDELAKVVAPEESADVVSSLPTINAATADVYSSFAKTFVETVFSLRASDESMNCSIMDAFFDLGIDANLSKGIGQTNVMAYFGGHSLAEVNSAAKDLRRLMVVVQGDDEENTYGSALMNGLFFGRALSLDESRTDIGKILSEDYGVYVFHSDPNKENVNLFLNEQTPAEYFDPLLFAEGDGLPKADAADKVLSLSAFDYYAHYNGAFSTSNKNQYAKGNQRLDYTDKDGVVSSVPYGLEIEGETIYQGSHFVACDSSLGTTFFKPDSASSPWSIIGDVISSSYLDGGTRYLVTGELPYFKTDSKTTLPPLGTYEDGVLAALVKGIGDSDFFLTSQKSSVCFNYEGLTNRSITWTGYYTDPGDTLNLGSYSFVIDSPFAYRQDLAVGIVSSSAQARLPLFLGAVDVPNYVE